MVRRELHGQGLGRALVEIRIERIRADPNVETVLLNTCQHTVGFYERLGFRTLDVTIDGYAPGLDRCEMSLSLPSATLQP
jgi:ribosomal protein S18 acetylase RimI-like enzyme